MQQTNRGFSLFIVGFLCSDRSFAWLHLIRILQEKIVNMSRPMLLVFLLLILIITSQFEWKQQLVSDMDTSPSVSQKQLQISKREEAVKEKYVVIS
ncbi:unnamed protein product [Thlaspi arvense]|uniref:Uncharacterized protein n=1 Tax=Thlaspi arvense TaxID=13288 RepID=A0AAU9RK03_THLAR|nr:unnamed protein product [Thlaspi arvense]